MNATRSNATETDLRHEVEELAKIAFQNKLISGYGGSEYIYEYQIVYNGKPRHFPLHYARYFLSDLVERSV